MRRILCLLLVLGITVSARAEVDTRALVEQLGATSYKARKAAAQKIRDIGAPALPALRAAADSDDPEVRFRVAELLPEIMSRAAAGLAREQQLAASARLNVPVEKTLDLGDGIKLQLILIPSGEFQMGTDRNAGRSGPVHAVKIAKPFYMGKFPVTQAQYQRVVGANPSRQKGDDLPVGRVPIAGIEGFCQKTSKTTGAAIRLPTEAEWEFACRAGTRTKYYNGDAENDLDKAAWYENNSGGNVQPVGKKQPNPFGLHDMLGNTWEMCEDDWQYGYRNAAADGSAFKNNPRSDRRVIRGGTERLGAELTTCAHRSGTDTAGFRVVVTAQQAGD